MQKTAKKTPFIIDISPLLEENNPSKLEIPIQIRKGFTKESLGFPLMADIEGVLLLERVNNGMLSKFKMEAMVELECQRCINPFKTLLNIEENTYLFYLKPPKNTDDKEKNYCIEIDDRTINIEEPLRQEIILAVPYYPLCKDTCEGLCNKCRKDVNTGECKCKKESKEEPFKALKGLSEIYKKAKGWGE